MKHLGGTTALYRFSPKSRVTFEPGQYAHFSFPFVVGEKSAKQHRTFTICSLPTDDTIEFITRLDTPMSAYKQQLFSLQPGDHMYMDEPRGDLVLPLQSDRPLVFVAQGIGIASFLPLLRECARSDLSHPISLLWAIRGETDRGVLAIPGETCVSERQDFIAPSRLSVDAIMQRVGPESLVYISGSETFTMTLVHDLRQRGVTDDRLIFDYFTGYSEL